VNCNVETTAAQFRWPFHQLIKLAALRFEQRRKLDHHVGRRCQSEVCLVNEAHILVCFAHPGSEVTLNVFGSSLRSHSALCVKKFPHRSLKTLKRSVNIGKTQAITEQRLQTLRVYGRYP